MATPQDALPAATIEKWTGLYKSVGRFAVPPGAMEAAANVVIPGPSLLEPRRGFRAPIGAGFFDAIGNLGVYGPTVAFFAIPDPAPNTPSWTLFDSETEVATSIFREIGDQTLDPATLDAVGLQVPAVTAYRRFFTSNGNLYCNGLDFGVAVESVRPSTSSSYPGWAPAGMDKPIMAGGFSFVAGTFLNGPGETANGITYKNGAMVAYRTTYKYADNNGNVHRSAPSEKLIVYRSTGAATAVRVLMNPTPMVRSGTIIELWRTFTVPIPDDFSDATGDECFKIAELAITANINGGTNWLEATGVGTPFASYDDNTPNTPYLVEPLYTNPTTGDVNGLGIGNANVMPPSSVDTFQFKGYTYYANTQEVQRLQVQIIGTGSPGIQDGDTFSVDGVQYQWKDTLPAAAGFIGVLLWRVGGSNDKGTIVQNLTASAQAAADAINKGNGLYGPAFNTLSPQVFTQQKIRAWATVVNDLGGYLAMERIVPNGTAFSILPGTGAGRGWAGLLAVANTSDPNRQPNGLMQSQFNDPESVPPAFTELVGHSDCSILRGVPLRDTSLLFKTAPDGLWKFTDDGNGNLTIASLDATVNLIAPNTAVFLDNSCYALCDKGVLRITDGGSPENISDGQIQEQLEALVAHAGPDTLNRVAFAVAYEAEKRYVLCLPGGPGATSCTIQYVYNLVTNSWTPWDIPAAVSGVVSPFDGKLYVGRDENAYGGSSLWQERKNLSDTDYQDEESTKTVPSPSSTRDTLVYSGNQTGRVSGFTQGDRVSYTTSGVNHYAYVDDVTYDGATDQTTVTLSTSLPFVASETFTLQKAVQCWFELLPLVDGDPLYDKQWQDLYLYFGYLVNDRLQLRYATIKKQVSPDYPADGPEDVAWYDDDLGWGDLPWGGLVTDVVVHQGIPQDFARSPALTIRIDLARACAGWQMTALRCIYLPTTVKSVK